MRSAIEQAVPHGTSKGRRDNGTWGMPPAHVDAVIHAQRDLVEVVHTLRQVVRVKG